MVVLWQKLDLQQHLHMKAPGGATMLAEMLEQDWIFEFLVWFNLEFDEVRGRMLGKKLFPFVDETFSY